VLILIIGLALLWLWLWPWLSQSFRGLQTFGRGLVAGLSILPLALLLGIPFPLGLRLVGQFSDGDRHVALAWAVNGVFTVVGSVVTVALAMLVGFSTVLLVGVAAYTIAALFIFVVSR
jgi:hypothetical protein